MDRTAENRITASTLERRKEWEHPPERVPQRAPNSSPCIAENVNQNHRLAGEAEFAARCRVSRDMLFRPAELPARAQWIFTADAEVARLRR